MLVKPKPLLLIMSYILSIFTMLKLCFLLGTGQRESSHVWITSLNYLSRKNKESEADVFHPPQRAPWDETSASQNKGHRKHMHINWHWSKKA